MAVTKAYPRLKIEILVSDIPLEEFNDEDEQVSPNTTTKFIESQSGVEFEIRSSLSKPWPVCSLLLQVYVDGKYVRSWFMMQRDFEGDTLNIAIQGQSYSKDDKWFLQKFCFSELKIDDSGVPAVSDQLMKDLKGLGEITVKAYRVKNLRQKPAHEGLSAREFGTVGDVPEKALKGRALSHQLSFRPPLATTASRIWEHDYMDDDRDPMATFSFKYRSRAALRSLLIIPRSPSPVPLEDRDVDTLTQAESRELIRRLREREDATNVVKREGVKRERSRERSSTVYYIDGGSDEDISFVSAKRRRLPVSIDEDGVETIDLT